MDADVQKMITALESQLGYKEKSGGYTKFGDWYGENVDDSSDFSHAAWCDMFLAWGADQAGVTAKTGQFAYTPAHAAWFREQDAWGTKPEPGAFVFYDWSGGKKTGGIDHVGIVTKVDGSKIHTIEGNVDGVNAKRKIRDQSKVVGYGYPRKVNVTEAEAEAPAAAQAGAVGSTGSGGSAQSAALTGSALTGSALTGTVSLPGDFLPAEPSALFAAIVFPAVALAVAVRRRLRPGRGRHHRLATA
ncbi:CHAP domain-containing protein [Actinocorallia longicatena]|uniref:Peptidase C51 domain-containing protein n=1 Tax=Actinocorallia longicatena TaxID=111803 RepID=A0ABP6QME3_9ACTN